MKRAQFIKPSKGGYNVGLNISMIKEGETFVASCPALDLTSCGATFEEAKYNILEAIHLFLDECKAMGTLDQVLKECGWNRTIRNHKREMIPPRVVATLSESICIPA